VTCEVGWSCVSAGALVLSKRSQDIAFGMSCRVFSLGAVSETVAWDREGAIHDGHGNANEAFTVFCGPSTLACRVLQARDPGWKGALKRTHRFIGSKSVRAQGFTAGSVPFPSAPDRGGGAQAPAALSSARHRLRSALRVRQ